MREMRGRNAGVWILVCALAACFESRPPPKTAAAVPTASVPTASAPQAAGGDDRVEIGGPCDTCSPHPKCSCLFAYNKCKADTKGFGWLRYWSGSDKCAEPDLPDTGASTAPTKLPDPPPACGSRQSQIDDAFDLAAKRVAKAIKVLQGPRTAAVDKALAAEFGFGKAGCVGDLAIADILAGLEKLAAALAECGQGWTTRSGYCFATDKTTAPPPGEAEDPDDRWYRFANTNGFDNCHFSYRPVFFTNLNADERSTTVIHEVVHAKWRREGHIKRKDQTGYPPCSNVAQYNPDSWAHLVATLGR